VSTSSVENYVKQYSAQMGRVATEDEIRGFIEKHIRDEILSREAISLGLDQGDIVIRRRLVQKLDFMTDELTQVEPPTEDEIVRYFEENKSVYAAPDRVSFSQVFLNPEGLTSDEAFQRARDLKARLNTERATPENAYQYSSPTLLETFYQNMTREDLQMSLGSEDLFDKIWDFSTGIWEGPVESGFGMHLILATDKNNGEVPELKKVRQLVIQDLVLEKEANAKKAFMDNLKTRYAIKIDEELKPYYEDES